MANALLKGHLMNRGTLMVLKRLLVTTLAALGLSALVAGPVAAQTQIPAPELLGSGTAPCDVSKMELETQGIDPRTALDFSMLAECDDADDDVADFRMAHNDHAAAQKSLSGYIRGANSDDRITTAEEQRIAFLTDVRDKALVAKDENVGNALAEAVYSEQDAIAALKQLDGAIDHETDGYDAALKTALLEHHNYVVTYTDDEGVEQTAYLAPFSADDLTAVDPTMDAAIDTEGRPVGGTQPSVAESIVEQLETKRTDWDERTDVYDDDGDLMDFEDLLPPAKMVAVELANAERRLAAAKRAASAQVTALGNAKSALKAGKDAVEDGEDAVRDTMKVLADRAAGAGDSAATRLAQVRSNTQKAYDDAAEDLADAQEDLDDSQDDLSDLEDDLDDAESDRDSAQESYDAAVDGIDDTEAVTDDEQDAVDAAAVKLAAADKVVQDLTGKVRTAKGARDDDQDKVDDEAKLAAKAKEALDEATSGSFEYTAENPAGALLDALVKQDDTGEALVDAIDQTYQYTAANKAALDAMTDVGADVDANTANIATNMADIESLDGRVATNETGIAANTTAIGVNTTGIADNKAAIGVNTGYIMANSGRIDANEMGISMNSDAIGANSMNIASNERNISGNTAMIGELSESLEVVRAGVAASMALAGMPAINGRGISIGVGSFDGESAFAVGFQIQNESTSFKVGVTSGGGATGASAGVGFQF